MRKIDRLIEKYTHQEKIMTLTEVTNLWGLTKFMFKIAGAKSVGDARKLSSILGDVDDKLWNEYIKILDRSPDEEPKIQKYAETELKYKGDIRDIPADKRPEMWAITLYLAKSGELRNI